MIHYHGTPITGPIDAAARFLARRHAFVSFADPRHIEIVADACQSFALDNGAFTEWRRGRSPDWGAYAEWVAEWNRHPGYDWHVIPDAIEGTARDNDALIERWFTKGGVPVWHLHESIDRLTDLCALFRTVAIGSSGEYAQPNTDRWWHRMAEAMNAACDAGGRPLAKLHGLRMLNPEVFTRLPLASADSTSAAQNAAFESNWRVYKPREAWQRAAVIADRVEAFNSAPTWSGAMQICLGF